MVHDNPLPNYTCGDCGTDFFSENSGRVYCDECSSYDGEKNPMYSGGKETTTCDICSTDFDYYPSEKEGNYCSDCVKSEPWRNIPEPLFGEEHPTYNSVVVDCSNCGQNIEVRQSELTDKNYCDMNCFAEHRSEFQKGEENPNYKQGEYRTSEFYQGKWGKVKKKCKERDDEKCQVCGKEQGIIDVHHIRPVRKFDDPNDAHTLDNVVCLCRSCHMGVDHGNKELPKDLSTSSK